MKFYADYVAAETALLEIDDLEQVLVLSDETRDYKVAGYHKAEDALVFDGQSTDGIFRFADPAPDAEFSAILSEIKVPANLDENGGDKAVDYTLAQIAKNYFTSPPGSVNETYSTISFGRGWNIGANGLRINTTRVGFGHFEEYYYIQEGVVASEYQHRFYDLEGIEHRLWQTFMPHDWAEGGRLSTNQFSAGRHRIYDENDVPIVLYDLHDRTIDIREEAVFRFDVNNVPVMQQMNSTGSLVNLPRVNAADFLEQQQPGYLVTTPATMAGLVTWNRRVFKDPVDGAYVSVEFLYSALTGTLNYSYFAGDVSANICTTLINTNATGGIRQKFVTFGGDITKTTQVGSYYWIWGHKASDNSWRLSPTGFIGNGDAIIVGSTTKDVTLGGHLLLGTGKAFKIAGQQVVGARQNFIADPTGGTTTDNEARTSIAAILDLLAVHGLMASA